MCGELGNLINLRISEIKRSVVMRCDKITAAPS